MPMSSEKLKFSSVLLVSSILLGSAFICTTPSLGMELPREEEVGRAPSILCIECIESFPEEVMAQCVEPTPKELRKMALVSQKWKNHVYRAYPEISRPIYALYYNITMVLKDKENYIAQKKFPKLTLKFKLADGEQEALEKLVLSCFHRLKDQHPPTVSPNRYMYPYPYKFESTPENVAMMIDCIGAYALATNSDAKDKNIWRENKDRDGQPLSIKTSRYGDMSPTEIIEATIAYVCKNKELNKLIDEETQHITRHGHYRRGVQEQEVLKSKIDENGNFSTPFNPYSPNYKPTLKWGVNPWWDSRPNK